MDEGKPSHIPSKAEQAEQGVERNTVSEEASQEVWQEVKDGGIDVQPRPRLQVTPQRPTPAACRRNPLLTAVSRTA